MQFKYEEHSDSEVYLIYEYKLHGANQLLDFALDSTLGLCFGLAYTRR